MYHYLLYPEYLNIMQIKLQIPLSKPETGEGEQAELFYEAFKSSDMKAMGVLQ